MALRATVVGWLDALRNIVAPRKANRGARIIRG
jgi:hypothetical protein